jgi:hypothetical protein
VTDWQRDIADALATIEELTRERDEARATIKRMKPVVDAAILWSDSDDSETEFALVDAVVAYESARDAT